MKKLIILRLPPPMDGWHLPEVSGRRINFVDIIFRRKLRSAKKNETLEGGKKVFILSDIFGVYLLKLFLTFEAETHFWQEALCGPFCCFASQKNVFRPLKKLLWAFLFNKEIALWPLDHKGAPFLEICAKKEQQENVSI